MAVYREGQLSGDEIDPSGRNRRLVDSSLAQIPAM
jgi:hypothetical protein